MKFHIVNIYLSRKGGGIFTVIKGLYNASAFKSSADSLYFWGYDDEFSSTDSLTIPGEKNTFPVKLPFINKFYCSKELRTKLNSSVSKNDIIHLHSLWLYPSWLITKIQSEKGIHKIISVHGMLDSWALKNGRLKKKIALKFLEKKNLNTADCIHALCIAEYNDIRKLAPNVPVAIIPNGINLPDITVNDKKKDHKVLLFLGRIHPKKGLENLIYAWDRIAPSDWKLVISGPDEDGYEEKLKRLVKSMKLTDSIYFPGPKYNTEKHDVLSSVDAFILPSFSEGLPMSVLEAWSYKLPVLMTPQCNLPDGFDTGSAIQIEPEIESIRIGLEKLFSFDDFILASMGINGYNLVCRKYTWKSISEQMIDLYNWVLGKIEKPDFVKMN